MTCSCCHPRRAGGVSRTRGKGTQVPQALLPAYPHSLSPSASCDHARMTTPILIAALERKPRRNPRAIRSAPRGEGAKTRADNYLAQAPKRKPGAPLGNRNATRGGAQKRERQAALNALIRSFHATADAAIAACEQGALERRALAALLEPRS